MRRPVRQVTAARLARGCRSRRRRTFDRQPAPTAGAGHGAVKSRNRDDPDVVTMAEGCTDRGHEVQRSRRRNLRVIRPTSSAVAPNAVTAGTGCAALQARVQCFGAVPAMDDVGETSPEDEPGGV